MVLFFIIVFLVLLSTYTVFGGFKKIEFQTKKAGGESLIYMNVTGSYHNAYKFYEKVYNELLEDHKIEAERAFGIYHDNPKHVAQLRLNSHIGCIVENIDEKTLEKVKEDFEFKILPVEDYLVTEYPFRGSFSIILGMTRIHPLIRKYLAENNYAEVGIIEIYDYPNSKIIYLAPLRKPE